MSLGASKAATQLKNHRFGGTFVAFNNAAFLLTLLAALGHNYSPSLARPLLLKPAQKKRIDHAKRQRQSCALTQRSLYGSADPAFSVLPMCSRDRELKNAEVLVLGLQHDVHGVINQVDDAFAVDTVFDVSNRIVRLVIRPFLTSNAPAHLSYLAVK